MTALDSSLYTYVYRFVVPTLFLVIPVLCAVDEGLCGRNVQLMCAIDSATYMLITIYSPCVTT